MLTLKLNADYTPISVVSWQEAVGLWYIGKAEMVEEYPDVKLRSPSIVVPCPSVIRLKDYVKRRSNSPVYSRANLFTRDNYTCQYCGQGFTDEDLTVDHISPKSRGGKRTWDNTTTSCFPCNSKKGDRTPEEAGMKLLSHPYKPKYSTNFRVRRTLKNKPAIWDNYIS